MLIFYF